MQFLVLTRRRSEAFTDADFASRMDAEVQSVRALYMEGILRQIWLRGDVRGACLLLESPSETEARAALDTLPMVQATMLEVVSVTPLSPYAGFGPRKDG